MASFRKTLGYHRRISNKINCHFILKIMFIMHCSSVWIDLFWMWEPKIKMHWIKMSSAE